MAALQGFQDIQSPNDEANNRKAECECAHRLEPMFQRMQPMSRAMTVANINRVPLYAALRQYEICSFHSIHQNWENEDCANCLGKLSSCSPSGGTLS